MTYSWQKQILVTITALTLAIPAVAEDIPPTTLIECSRAKGTEALICHTQGATGTKLLQEDMYNAGLFGHALRNTPPGSPEQERIIQSQREYLKQRDACGNDTACIMRVMKARHQELIALNKRLQVDLPDAEIARFIGNAYVKPVGETGGAKNTPSVDLTDRILGAFEQYPPAHVKLADGSTFFWGFQQGNGSVRSIAITDDQGQVQLVGAVDDLPEITNAILPMHRTHNDISQNRHALKSGRIALFVRDSAALQRYLSAVQAWTWADLLGFNVSCNKDAQWQSRCAEVQQYRLPITAYNLNCKARAGQKILVERCPLPLSASSGQVSLENFRQ